MTESVALYVESSWSSPWLCTVFIALREKSVLLERLETIRTKSPDAVAQELWGILLVYNLVRLERERIADELGAPPTRISFVAALHHFAQLWLVGSKSPSPGALPKQLATTQDRIRRFLLPPRRPDRSSSTRSRAN